MLGSGHAEEDGCRMPDSMSGERALSRRQKKNREDQTRQRPGNHASVKEPFGSSVIRVLVSSHV